MIVNLVLLLYVVLIFNDVSFLFYENLKEVKHAEMQEKSCTNQN